MEKMTGAQIRRVWLDFFKQRGHLELESKSLIPSNDRSLLWINSGVATLKDYFSGKEVPPNRKLTNSQRAIRTNDIENVGKTARHHTFFEMLGNFSIGDYFKKEAIAMAYELLTDKFKFPIDLLYFTVYEEDQDAYDLWMAHGIKADHLIKGGKDTNFWDLGGGPCGPCTEIFFDRGEKYDPHKKGIVLLQNNEENERYIEIWNIVFSQFNNDGTGKLTELSQKNIDTGAGLERMAAVLQDVPTNFDTDLFMPIIRATEQLTEHKYDPAVYFSPASDPRHATNKAFKVIADHVRAVTFAISDGAIPSNKERGYIIRRLIRRAALYGHKLNIPEGFLSKLVPFVSQIMGDYYPYLLTHQKKVQEILDYEEGKFRQTIASGLALLEKQLAERKELSAEQAFNLFDTYGFPVELTEEYVSEKGGSIDRKGFDELFERHQERSRAPKTGTGMATQNEALLNLKVDSEFIYEQPEIKTNVVALFDEQQNRVEALDGQRGFVVLDKTVLYATSGGQEHDSGTISGVAVTKVMKAPNGQHLHLVEDGSFAENDQVMVRTDWHRRELTAKNHTAEHILHTVLKNAIDPAIKQEGSSKTAERLTFDFNYHKRLDETQIKKIEEEVARIINAAMPIRVVVTDLPTAKSMGALAYFTDTYEKIGKDKLRVIDIQGFGAELCGGTHVANTKEIETFKIVGLTAKGAASWRFECITSFETLHKYLDELKQKASDSLTRSASLADSEKHVAPLKEEIKSLQNTLGKAEGVKIETLYKEVEELSKKVELAAAAGKAEAQKELASALITLFINEQAAGSRHTLAFGSDSADIQLVDQTARARVWDARDLPAKTLADALGSAGKRTAWIQLVLNTAEGRLQYYVSGGALAKDAPITPLEFVKKLSAQIDGKGGGKPELAQGGTKDLTKKQLIIDLFNEQFA